ncbi:class I SAM-dependent methyltransferase [Propionicimonas sp.]|uniref:class I SAM-dependent methyltransferase n=1 Tax=Propionicimonas sp. TaxID=1955623 RepID=UPI0039E37CC4
MASVVTGVSRTAGGAALCRLAEQRQPPGLRQFDDPVVARLLDPMLVAIAQARPLLDQVLASWPPGTYGGQVMRTRYIDDVVVAAATEGVTQVVILGAGLDTRAYRLPELATATVFEVDLPVIQRRKRRHLRGVPVMAGDVRFVAADLGLPGLGDTLRDAGVDCASPTLFVCEGVTQYLGEAAVRSTLAAVAGFAAGSALVFTYVSRALVAARGEQRPTGGFPGFDASEPWLFGLDRAEVAGFVGNAGLHLVEDVGEADYQRRYLAPSGRELVVGPGERVALAVR